MVFEGSWCVLWIYPNLRANSKNFLISILCFPSGDRPNGIYGGRRLLLVHGRIRQPGTPYGFRFLPDRQSNDGCIDLPHCSGILLLSYLDIEQAGAVDLSVDCHRTSASCHFSAVLSLLLTILDILSRSSPLHKQSEQRGPESGWVSSDPNFNVIPNTEFRQLYSESMQL